MLKTIDWNQISELGLHERINREIMHPLGLAITRITADGTSPGAVVAPDQVFQYDPTITSIDTLTDDQIKARIQHMIKKDQVAYD